jgi:PPM family protein phosphatase
VVITAAAGSEVGNRYRANFDVAYLTTDPLVAVIADGMGDGPGSTMAGRTTVDLMAAQLTESVDIASIQATTAEAHRRVIAFDGFAGCTLTALAASGDGLWLVQLGDSRLYRLRAGLLELMTVDHTMAWLGAVHGWFPFDSPQAASARYQLTRYVGHPARPEPDIMFISPDAGDVYLLCTDGIAEQVTYQEVLTILGRSGPPAAKVRSLLAAAEAAGGNDNATAIVAEVSTGENASPATSSGR